MAQVRLARVIPSMHVHLCVSSWLISPHPSLFSTSFHRSPSSPSRCSPQCSTRSLGPTPCATSAWGPWPLLITRHPSQLADVLFQPGSETSSLLAANASVSRTRFTVFRALGTSLECNLFLCPIDTRLFQVCFLVPPLALVIWAFSWCPSGTESLRYLISPGCRFRASLNRPENEPSSYGILCLSSGFLPFPLFTGVWHFPNFWVQPSRPRLPARVGPFTSPACASRLLLPLKVLRVQFLAKF